MTTTTWQDTLAASVKKAEQGEKAKKQAGKLLWDGAIDAITEYVSDASSDAEGEQFYSDVLAAMGDKRKGDASKIKTVALAVVNNGLVLADYPNLSKAYAEATARTKTKRAHEAEDKAADEATSGINPPKTASAAEGAAAILLAKGVDEAARVLLSVMGKENHLAHRALLRAIAQEAQGLIPKPEPKAKPVKKAAAKKTAKKAAPKSGATKAKIAPSNKTEHQEAVADVVKKAVKKAAPKGAAKKAAAPAPTDMFDDLDDDTLGDEQVEVAPKPVKKAAPVRRGPVRR